MLPGNQWLSGWERGPLTLEVGTRRGASEGEPATSVRSSPSVRAKRGQAKCFQENEPEILYPLQGLRGAEQSPSELSLESHTTWGVEGRTGEDRRKRRKRWREGGGKRETEVERREGGEG